MSWYWNANSGYVGYSMSVRAKRAYEDGEMPLSKWTKGNMLARVWEGYEYEIEEGRITEDEAKAFMDLLNSYPVAFLKTYLLENTSWHHTSSQFNCTDFYDVKGNMYCCDFNSYKEEIQAAYQEFLEEKAKLKEEKANAGEDRRIIKYALWDGSLNRPKFLGYEEEEAIIRGNSAYPVNAKTFKDGKKRKLLTGSYVETIKYL